MRADDRFQRWLSDDSLSMQERRRLYRLADNKEAFLRAFGEPLTLKGGRLIGQLGDGPAHMNDRTARWLAATMASQLIDKGIDKGLLILGGEVRLHTDAFIETIARQLCAYGHHVAIWQDPIPASVLSWAIRYARADAGIYIGADAAPADWNGVTCYTAQGAPLSAQDDEDLANRYQTFLNGQDPKPMADLTPTDRAGQMQVVDPHMGDLYLADLLYGEGLLKDRQKDDGPLSIIYTALHGAGGNFIPDALAECGFNDFREVEGQAPPDGSFPDLTRPNPSDAQALEEACRLGYVMGTDLILASDPPARRIGCAVRHKGDYVLLTPAQIAALLIDQLPQILPQPTNGVILAPLKGSPFPKRLALSRRFQVRDLPRGLAEVGRGCREIVADGGKLFLAYDDGALVGGNLNREGDAVFAAVALALVARRLKAFGRTLVDQLDLLYAHYGYWTDRHFDYEPAMALPRDLSDRTLAALADMPAQEVFGRPVRLVLDYRRGTFWLAPTPLLQYVFPGGSHISLAADPGGRRLQAQVYATASQAEPARHLAEDLTGQLRQALRLAAEQARGNLLN
ncbi:hypothetical protein ACLGL1_01715 [Peptococcus simiae]|uniref:hypothetical protein n=1 Tax=Peptococcus simiae TaxID=1643805 RepID=UPI003980C253